MKKVILSLALTVLISPLAFALEDLQCSNADGSLKRVETEIWGANDVKWLYNGEEVAGAQEDFMESSKVVLSKEESRSPNGKRLLSKDEKFAQRVTVSAVAGNANFRVTDFVICKSHWDDRRD